MDARRGLMALPALIVAVLVSVGLLALLRNDENATAAPRADTSLPQPAAAQPGLTDRGVNVQGFGQASAPATNATLQFLFGPNGYVVPEDGAIPSIVIEDLQPVVDALLAIGVAPEDIEASVISGGYYGKGYAETSMDAVSEEMPAPGYPYGGETGQVLARVGEPASERLREIVTVATDAANATGTLVLHSVGALYEVADCAGLRQQALVAAVSNATDNARPLAAAIGAQLGGVTFVSDYGSYDPYGYGSGSGSCAPPPAIERLTYYPPFDPNQPVELRVMASLNVTFAAE